MTSPLLPPTLFTSGAIPAFQGAGVPPDRQVVARQKFDAYFMQAVLEQALPKKAEAVFGHGFSGDVMRSMLAEKVAAEISKRGCLSISGQVFSRSEHLSRSSLLANVEPVSSGSDQGVIHGNIE